MPAPCREILNNAPISRSVQPRYRWPTTECERGRWQQGNLAIVAYSVVKFPLLRPSPELCFAQDRIRPVRGEPRIRPMVDSQFEGNRESGQWSIRSSRGTENQPGGRFAVRGEPRISLMVDLQFPSNLSASQWPNLVTGQKRKGTVATRKLGDCRLQCREVSFVASVPVVGLSRVSCNPG